MYCNYDKILLGKVFERNSHSLEKVYEILVMCIEFVLYPYILGFNVIQRYMVFLWYDAR